MLAQLRPSKAKSPLLPVSCAARHGVRCGWFVLPALLAVLPARAQFPAPLLPVPEVTVAYVSEVPWPADAGAANPLERWAKQLSAAWAAPASEGNARLNNLRPELSWDRLKKSALNRKADVFTLHGYEWLESGTSAQLEVLLTPARDGKAALTEFVILRPRAARPADGDRKFTMQDLEDSDILVDRGGCGELVYRWLDVEIVPVTGDSRRENFAEFRSASSATEAVLAVYFGDADACVVSRAAYDGVLRTNPAGIEARLEVVRCSPLLLQHVVACRRDLRAPLRGDLLKSAAAIRLTHEGVVWGLIEPVPANMQSLTALIGQWRGIFKATAPETPESAAAPGPTAAVAPVPTVKTRRLP